MADLEIQREVAGGENDGGGRYVVRLPGKPEAEMTFTNRGPGVISIDHTIVPKEMGGMGVGTALVKHMVEDVRARKLKIIPLCPFTRALLEKHAEWQDILKDPL